MPIAAIRKTLFDRKCLIENDMPTTKIGSSLIYYDIRGTGPAALLFNHSGTSSLSWSERFLEALAEELTVITPDHRGTGRSSHASVEFSLADLAADGRAVLDEERIDEAVIVGTSMGGCVAQEFALGFPQRVSSVVLMGTFAGAKLRVPPDPHVLELLEPPAKPLSKVESLRRMLPSIYSPRFLAQHEDLALELELKGRLFNTAETLKWHGVAVSKFDAYDRLPSISAPTLVVHGTDDPIIPIENGEILAGRIPNAEFVSLEGIGHLPAVEAPMEMAGRILSFAH